MTKLYIDWKKMYQINFFHLLFFFPTNLLKCPCIICRSGQILRICVNKCLGTQGYLCTETYLPENQIQTCKDSISFIPSWLQPSVQSFLWPETTDHEYFNYRGMQRLLEILHSTPSLYSGELRHQVESSGTGIQISSWLMLCPWLMWSLLQKCLLCFQRRQKPTLIDSPWSS